MRIVQCRPLLAICCYYFSAALIPFKKNNHDTLNSAVFNILPLKAFLLPSCEASATRKVIKVYRKWILLEKPCFMTEPDTHNRRDEVDDSSEQTLNTENSMNVQVKIQMYQTFVEDYTLL